MDIAENYRWLMEEKSDFRSKDWFLISTPLWPLALGTLYLATVLYIAPLYMKSRPAYTLKTFTICYNIYQLIACTYLFWAVLHSGWTTTYSWGCQPVDYSNNPEPVKMLNLMYWVFLLKVSEFVETVVFVLRKKERQVSFLHLYHHVSTMALAWIGVRFVGGGMASFPVMPNCLVHIIMYTYYLLSISKNTTLQKYLNKFKPYLTIIQMIQFCIIVGHAMQAFLPSCHVPTFLAYIYIPNVFFIFYLFHDFYKANYLTPSSQQKQKAKKA